MMGCVRVMDGHLQNMRKTRIAGVKQGNSEASMDRSNDEGCRKVYRVTILARVLRCLGGMVRPHGRLNRLKALGMRRVSTCST